MATIEELQSKPLEEKVPQLGEMLRQLKTLHYRECSERDQTIEALQAVLLAIPGHAEYFRDRINEARGEMDAINPEANSALWNHQHNLWKSTLSGFGVLGNLPSLNSVKILGDYLTDERGKFPYPLRPQKGEPDEKFAEWRQNLDSWAASWPHSHYAMLALHRLPITSKPFKTGSTDGSLDVPEIEDAVAAWKQWYQEIKDGKRTFRFEGDPTEYDLNGPAPKEKLERIAMHQRMESDRAVRHRTAGGSAVAAESDVPGVAPAPSMALTIVLNLAGLAVLAAAVWYFAKARDRRA